jgi:hypothetical protein
MMFLMIKKMKNGGGNNFKTPLDREISFNRRSR